MSLSIRGLFARPPVTEEWPIIPVTSTFFGSSWHSAEGAWAIRFAPNPPGAAVTRNEYISSGPSWAYAGQYEILNNVLILYGRAANPEMYPIIQITDRRFTVNNWGGRLNVQMTFRKD